MLSELSALFFLSSADIWNLFGPKLSERHRSCAGELVRENVLLVSYRQFFSLFFEAHLILLICFYCFLVSVDDMRAGVFKMHSFCMNYWSQLAMLWM